jgi:ERCC4-type nuclease
MKILLLCESRITNRHILTTYLKITKKSHKFICVKTQSISDVIILFLKLKLKIQNAKSPKFNSNNKSSKNNLKKNQININISQQVEKKN